MSSKAKGRKPLWFGYGLHASLGVFCAGCLVLSVPMSGAVGNLVGNTEVRSWRHHSGEDFCSPFRTTVSSQTSCSLPGSLIAPSPGGFLCDAGALLWQSHSKVLCQDHD